MNNFAVLWDMDGVLTDSTRLHYLSWVKTLKKRGLEVTYEKFIRTFGQNNQAVLTGFFDRPPTAEELTQIPAEKEGWFRDHIVGNVELLPGVVRWLQRFQSWGAAQAVASSGPPENIAAQVDALGIRPYFNALVSSAGLPGKPDPAVYLKAAAELGVTPDHCLVVEDAPAGVEGARRAGMRCLAVLTTQTANALQGADKIVYRLTELTEAQARQLVGLPAI